MPPGTTGPNGTAGRGRRPANGLELALRGTCAPGDFLDIIKNFLVLQCEKQKSGAVRLVKKVPRNHQVLGVNRAVQAVRDLAGNFGQLGVFRHTQSSGKSLSMLDFARKVFRKLAGNRTFVVITDRTDLDIPIAETFAACGALRRWRSGGVSSIRDLMVCGAAVMAGSAVWARERGARRDADFAPAAMPRRSPVSRKRRSAI